MAISMTQKQNQAQQNQLWSPNLESRKISARKDLCELHESEKNESRTPETFSWLLIKIIEYSNQSISGHSQLPDD